MDVVYGTLVVPELMPVLVVTPLVAAELLEGMLTELEEAGLEGAELVVETGTEEVEIAEPEAGDDVDSYEVVHSDSLDSLDTVDGTDTDEDTELVV